MAGLRGAVALVTGAAGAIGGAIAEELRRAGAARLLLLGRDAARLWPRAEALGAEVVECDLAGAALPTLPERLDVLVHAAGAHGLGPVATTPDEVLDAQLSVNLRAPFRLTRAALPALVAAEGQVVFINSSQGLSAGREASAYAASKHALRALADSLRQEVNEQGVRVLSVYPGRTASAMQEAVFAREGRAYAPERLMQPGDVAAMVMAALSLPRSAEVTEITMRPMRKA